MNRFGLVLVASLAGSIIVQLIYDFGKPPKACLEEAGTAALGQARIVCPHPTHKLETQPIEGDSTRWFRYRCTCPRTAPDGGPR